MWLANMMQEDGKTSMYTWILSTGWWAGRAPINPDAVVVVGVLCTCLIGGFIYINRVKPSRAIKNRVQASPETDYSHSSPILFMVCKPDIPGWASSRSSWRGSWSWCPCVFVRLFLSPSLTMHCIHQSWEMMQWSSHQHFSGHSSKFCLIVT